MTGQSGLVYSEYAQLGFNLSELLASLLSPSPARTFHGIQFIFELFVLNGLNAGDNGRSAPGQCQQTSQVEDMDANYLILEPHHHSKMPTVLAEGNTLRYGQI